MQNLQFITHYTEQYGYTDAARLALEGGCRWIQLRMKDASPEEWMRTGEEVEALCRRYGATFILDDHVEWVDVLHADGVHLGKSDMPIDEARRLLGQDRIIGGTANTLEDVMLHAARGADYIGCGPFRFTTTKRKARPDPRLGRVSPDLGRHEKERHFATTDCHRRNYKRRHPSVDGNGSGRHRPERHDPESRKSHRRNPEHPENIERTTIIKQQIYGR